MKELIKVIFCTVLIWQFAAADLPAQSRSGSKAKSSAKKKSTAKRKVSRGRLPRYYTHLDLDDEQRDEIFDIQEAYKEKLAELKEQLEELRELQAEEYKDVLTRSQVITLNKYLAGSLKVGGKKSTSKTSSKSSTAKEPSGKKSASRKSTSKKTTSKKSSSRKTGKSTAKKSKSDDDEDS